MSNDSRGMMSESMGKKAVFVVAVLGEVAPAKRTAGLGHAHEGIIDEASMRRCDGWWEVLQEEVDARGVAVTVVEG